MITINQMAADKGVSRQRINVLVNQKRIKAKKVGNMWIILSETIKPVKNGRPKKVS